MEHLFQVNSLWAFVAGLLSILSPCILPVLPIIIAGESKEHFYRPVFLVFGLTLSFAVMGVLSTLLGAPFQKNAYILEILSGILFIIFGFLFILGKNPFSRFTLLSSLQNIQTGSSLLSGLFLGILMGFVWIPCIGPQLSSILAMVAIEGSLLYGIFLLCCHPGSKLSCWGRRCYLL